MLFFSRSFPFRTNVLIQKAALRAVPEQSACTVHRHRKMKIPFRILPEHHHAAVRHIGRERNVMLLGHRVTGGNIPLPADVLDRQHFFRRSPARFQRREPAAAAGHCRFARSRDDIPAGSAYIKPHPFHIAVLLFIL